MDFKFFIATRFFLSEEKEYKTLYSAFFGEIVTMDSILCKKRFFDPISHEYVGIMNDYQKIQNFPLAQNEQLIKFMEVKAEIPFDNEDEFEFCGFDIMDYFEDNSWLTGYGIRYENNDPKYTKYGLLESFSDSLKWAADHAQTSRELENGEYKIFVVWRKTNPILNNKKTIGI